MNYDQWLFEAKGLQEKEKSQMDLVGNVYEASVQAFRECLIHLLGLNIGAGLKKEEADPTPFIPMLISCGRPEIVEKLVEASNNEDSSESAASNTDLDKLNEEFMSWGDMDPVIEDAFKPKPKDFSSDEHKNLLKSLGIELYDGDTRIE